MKHLWGWIRHEVALFLSTHMPEWGGMLYDYNNGKLDQLLKIETDKDAALSFEMVDNMLNSGRDFIYFSVVKVGNGRGYFVVFDTDRGFYSRGFWGSIYTTDEAFHDVLRYCRKRADKMGWRKPEVEGI